MLIGELLDLLSEYPEDMVVLKSKDAEWNSIRQVNGTDIAYAEDPKQYEVSVADGTDILEGHFTYDGEPGNLEDYTKVLVIW